MAFPTLLFNSSTGSDTLASGAGPGTAITGTAARSAATQNRSIGFYGATDDLSGVATDGSAVVFLNVATAGQRNFGSITTVKNTRQTGSDGAITTGTAILAVGSTTGWATNNSVKVAGAGAGGTDLYSTVLTVDSPTQATLNDNAGTTVGPAAAWENPKQVLLATSNGITAAADTAWAIGGKRLTLFGTNSLKLFTNNSAAGDAMEGWILEMDSAYTETRASVVDVRRVGTSTGIITLRGASGAGTVPVLTFSNNGNAFALRGTGWMFCDFTMVNTNATKTASIAFISASGGAASAFTRLKIDDSTNKFWKAIQNNTSGWYINDCDIGFCALTGIELLASSVDTKIINCWIHDCTSHGITSACNTAQDLFAYNLIETNGGDGINSANGGGGTTIADGGGGLIIGNTIAYNTGDGFEISTVPGAATSSRGLCQLSFINNIFANNGGWGINLSGTGWTDASFGAYLIQVLYNDFFTNTSGALGGSGSGLTLPATNSILDPQFVDPANGNFSIGLNVAGLGIPGARNVGANLSATLSALDIGVSQRQPPGGSGYLLVAP